MADETAWNPGAHIKTAQGSMMELDEYLRYERAQERMRTPCERDGHEFRNPVHIRMLEGLDGSYQRAGFLCVKCGKIAPVEEASIVR